MHLRARLHGPGWAKDAVIYQIFPDRFRNGRSEQRPEDGRRRATTTRSCSCRGASCPRATAATTPTATPTARGASTRRRRPTARPRSSRAAATTAAATSRASTSSSTTSRRSASHAIYFNPIFDAGSNHGYDTQDYTQDRPVLRHPEGLRRTSSSTPRRAGSGSSSTACSTTCRSDSPFFDRYHHYSTVGACESTSSPYRSWFTFHDVGRATAPACRDRRAARRRPTTAGSGSTRSR